MMCGAGSRVRKRCAEQEIEIEWQIGEERDPEDRK